MKNKLWTLFKYTTINSYKIGKGIKLKIVPQNIIRIIIGILLLGVIVAYSSLYSYIAYDILSKYNVQEYVPILFYILGFLAIFMFSIYKAKGVLFDSKDNDMLFSMPIKFGTVLSSRILTLLSTNYLFAALIFIPSVVIYSIYENVGLMYFINSFCVFILLPLIPTVLASFVGYIVAYIASRTGNKKTLETIFTFVLFFGIMISINYITQNITKVVVNVEEFSQKFKQYGTFAFYAKDAIIDENIISLLVYILFNILIFGIFVLVLAKQYIKIISRLNSVNSVLRKNGKVDYKISNKNKALLKKEFKRYFSSPIYVFNTAFGVVSLVLVTIYAMFTDVNSIKNIMDINMPQAGNSLFNMAIFLSIFIISLSNTTCSSISLEGKNFWILKSLPLEIYDIFKSKLRLNFLVIVPLTVLCMIVIGILSQFTLIQIIINCVLIVILNLCVSQFGLIINLKYPKLDFVSDTQVVKQSMSTFIGMLGPMVFAMLVMVVYGFVSKFITIEVFSLLFSVVLVIIYFIQKNILKTKGIKMFKEI